MSREYDNGVVRLWIGPKLTVFLFDPRDIELILSSQIYIDKSTEYRFFAPWLGEGLLISTGEGRKFVGGNEKRNLELTINYRLF